MSGYGDDDGALDAHVAERTELDEEQVARRLHELRRYFDPRLADYDRLKLSERLIAVAIAAAIIDWLRREGHLG